MNKHYTSRKALLSVILLIIVGMIISCERESSTGPRVWIDSPRGGISIPLGTSVTVVSHAYARKGLAEIVLYVNGEAYQRNAPDEAGTDFSDFSQEWIPSEAGTYTLQLRAYNIDGETGNPATISVEVGSTPTVVPASDQCAADELVAPVLVSPPDGATLTPDPVLEWSYPDDSCHPYSYTIDISEDSSFADISWGFGTLDHTETSRTWPLPAGACYYWRAKAYVPDMNGPDSSVRSFCIGGTTGTVTGTVTPTPTVTPITPTNTPITPTDTPIPPTSTDTPTPTQDNAPPPVPTPQSPANEAALSCAASATLTWSAVSDASGIATYYIKLEKQITADNWQSAGGYTSSTTQVDVPVDCGLIYRWSVRAEDGAGNISAWSSASQFGVNLD